MKRSLWSLGMMGILVQSSGGARLPVYAIVLFTIMALMVGEESITIIFHGEMPLWGEKPLEFFQCNYKFTPDDEIQASLSFWLGFGQMPRELHRATMRLLAYPDFNGIKNACSYGSICLHQNSQKQNNWNCFRHESVASVATPTPHNKSYTATGLCTTLSAHMWLETWNVVRVAVSYKLLYWTNG